MCLDGQDPHYGGSATVDAELFLVTRSRKQVLALVGVLSLCATFVRFDMLKLPDVRYDPADGPLRFHWRHRHPSDSHVTAIQQGWHNLVKADDYWFFFGRGDSQEHVEQVFGPPLARGIPSYPNACLWKLDVASDFGDSPVHYLAIYFVASRVRGIEGFIEDPRLPHPQP